MAVPPAATETVSCLKPLPQVPSMCGDISPQRWHWAHSAGVAVVLQSLADALSLPLSPGCCAVIVESLERFDLLHAVCCCTHRVTSVTLASCRLSHRSYYLRLYGQGEVFTVLSGPRSFSLLFTWGTAVDL
ncbi:hypothetical protein EK904_002256 [Melospiza melodia maxima]|nr:hypothetical protein EK904_002256 [Melospiza melodia maxima]